MPQSARPQPLEPALGYRPQISLTTLWDLCHQLEMHTWTMRELAARFGRTVSAMEKIFDRARRIYKTVGIELHYEPPVEKRAPAEYCIKDRLWQRKLERLRIQARRAQRQATR